MPHCFFDAVPGMAYAASAQKCTKQACKNEIFGGWKFCKDCSQENGNCEVCGISLSNYPVTEERIQEHINMMERCLGSYFRIYENRPAKLESIRKERDQYLAWAERLKNERLKNN